MADNELDSMQVSFGADFSQLDSAAGSVSDIFAEIAASADEASSNISDSFDMAGSAAMSFAEMSDMAAANAAAALDDSIPPATEEIDTAFADMASSASDSIDQINSQVTSMADHAEEAGSTISESTGSSGEGFMGMLSKVGMAAFGIQAFTSIVTQAGQALLGPAVSAETVTTALTTLDGSAKAAGQEMQNLNAFAAKTPFKTLDIDQAAEELQGFGISAKDTIPEITAIGDALGSVGRDTPAEMDSVVQIFGKINTEGKVTQMTMNELAVHGINGWQALADATGKTIPQVKQMVASGLLPANDAITDLTKGIEMNPLYKGGMSKAAGKFSGLLSTLQSNFQQILASFGSPIIKALEPELTKIGAAFSSPAFQSFAGSVGQGIVNVFTSIGTALHGLNIGSFASSFGNMSGVFKNLGSTLSVTLGSAFKAVGSILASINWGNVATTVGTLASVVGGVLTHAFQVFGPILAQVGKWFTTDVLPALNKALPPIGKLISSVMDFVGSALQPLLNALEPLVPPILTIAGEIASLLTPAIQKLTPVMKFIGPIIEDSTKPLQVMLDLLSGNWKGALNTIGLGFLSVGDKALQMKIKVAEAHTEMAAITAQKTAEGAAKAIANMEVERQGILQKLKETHDPAEKAELEHQLNMLDIDEKAQESKLQKAEEDKKALLKKQKNLHDAMLEAQKSGLQRMLDSIGNWFQHTLPDAVGNFFSGFGSFWHDRWTDITSSVGNIFSGVGSFVHNALNGVIDVVDSWIKSLNTLGVDVGPIHIHPNIPLIPHFATGGFLGPGQVGVAGEEGPELIFGGTSGVSVMNHAQSMAAMQGGGSNQPINVYFMVDGKMIASGMLPTLANGIIDATRSGHPIGAVA